MSEWKPIESAPKDGRRVLLTNGTLVGVGEWQRLCWGMSEYWSNEAEPTHTDGPGACAGYWSPEPTHWMPLPEPPSGPPA